MRTVKRLGMLLATAGLLASSMFVGVTGAAATIGLHGIGINKGCDSPTKIGDPYVCDYTIFNLNPIDSVGDTLTFHSVVDVVNRAPVLSSGNILSQPGIAAKVFFNNLGGGAPSCTGLGTATPLCTLPGSDNLGQGSSITIQDFSFTDVTAADYAADPVNHILTDTVTVTWNDVCDGSGPPTNCPGPNQTATSGSSTVIQKLDSSTATDIHNAAHAVVTTVAVGTTVHDLVTVTGQPNKDVPTGNVNIDWFLNGTCTGAPATNSGSVGPLDANGQFDATGFSFTVNTAGFRAFRAHYEGDGTYNPSDGPCEPLRVVDGRITIAPNATNRINSPHTFTATVFVNDGTGEVLAPDGTSVTFTTVDANGATSTPNPPTGCTTTGGSCTTTITSSTTGTSTVTAHTTVSVAGVNLTRATDTTHGSSGPAVKTWVNATISISPNAFNEVNHPHTFVATVLHDLGDGNGLVAAAGESVTVTLTPDASACPTPAGPFTGTTNGAGQFSVTFTSACAGTVTAHASSTLSVGGSASFTIQTDSQGGNSGDATKVFQDANIQITPNGTNRVGASHTFTAHVNANLGQGAGFQNAPDGTVITFTTVDANGATSAPNPPTSCTTSGGTGSCSTTISSPTTGTSTVSAHTTFTTPGGVVLTRSTDGVGANSGPAVKTWVNARISITPNATNEVNDPHTFTVTLQRDNGDGAGFVAFSGAHVDFSLANSSGAGFVLDAAASTCDNAGANTDAAGQCVIVFTSPTPGQVTGNASWTGTLGTPTPFTVMTNGTGGSSGPAVKTFVDANIQITPQMATNPVSTNHPLVGHVNINAGLGGGYVNAPDGTVITFSLTNSGGATASFVGPNTCTTAGGTGSCQVVISSSLSGTTTVKATTTVVVGGVSLTRATGDGKVGDSADATKLWADDTVRTDVHDAAHNVITSVVGPIAVHDKVFVTRTANTPAAVPDPTGNVVFHRYANLTCTGASVDETVALVGGVAESATFTASSDLCYQAEYLGDANYPARTGAIEPLMVAILVPNVDIIKFTNGADANDPDAAGVPDITPAGTVTWTYRVTNTGQTSVAQADVVVTDNITGVTPTFDSVITGDADTIFEPGEVWLYTATGIALDLAAPPPAGTVIVPGVCTQGGARPASNAYTNVGTVTIPGASDTDPSSYCNPPVLPCPAGTFQFSMNAQGDLVIKYDQFPAPNDNSYGVNAVGWGTKGHTFGNLVGSDHAGVQLKDANGVVRLSFNIDTISQDATAPSGYRSLGVTGGEGKMLVGTADGITADHSLSRNLNNTGYFAGGVQVVGTGVANLLVDSPPTLNTVDSYVLTPAAAAVFTAPNPDSADSPGWNFHNTFFATISAAKLAALGFDINTWTVEPNEDQLHNSPAKPCPCPVGVDPNPTVSVVNNANGTTTITYAQSLAVNDNSYGTGTDATWAGKTHTFSNLTGSDKLQVVITQGGVTKYDFTLDYLSAKAGAPSGYGSLGPTGGDGSTSVSQGPGSISAWTTSLDDNMNIACAPPAGPWTTNSPTSPGAAECPAWNFVNSYTVTVAGTFSAADVAFPSLHNSPSKPNVCPSTGGGSCNLAVTKTEVKDKSLKVTIKNNGNTDVILTALNNIKWPAANGKLLEIKLDGDSIYKPAGGVPQASSPISLTTAQLVADQNKRNIKKNKDAKLEFKFEKNASTTLSDYSGATAEFGANCTLSILP